LKFDKLRNVCLDEKERIKEVRKITQAEKRQLLKDLESFETIKKKQTKLSRLMKVAKG